MELCHRTAKINRNSNVCRQMAYKNERGDVVDVGVADVVAVIVVGVVAVVDVDVVDVVAVVIDVVSR